MRLEDRVHAIEAQKIEAYRGQTTSQNHMAIKGGWGWAVNPRGPGSNV